MSTIEDLSYFLPGNKNGVLLIHGLTGTPNEMRILANGLHKAGFTVYAIQLAGRCRFINGRPSGIETSCRSPQAS